ncbi:unnamed protein product [Brachionus calyciflorus]|uniref:Uncharacterized protein n=1 Tax=Brachionus calyciflorus TaxID=104777 RepID=A0A814DM70_9BILA|nr:unnamed protein product [Brachionus calyciflorus]
MKTRRYCCQTFTKQTNSISSTIDCSSSTTKASHTSIGGSTPEVEVTRDYKNLRTQLAYPEDYVRRFGSELLRHEEFKQAATRKKK